MLRHWVVLLPFGNPGSTASSVTTTTTAAAATTAASCSAPTARVAPPAHILQNQVYPGKQKKHLIISKNIHCFAYGW